MLGLISSIGRCYNGFNLSDLNSTTANVFLADCTNGRAIGTVVRLLSVRNELWICG